MPKNFFPEGSYVYVRDPKLLGTLLSHWDSPFKIARREKGDSLTLEDLTGQLIEFDCAPSRMKLVLRNPVEDDTNTYEIYEILNHRPNKRGEENETEYLIRWRSYSPEYDKWVLFTDFIETGSIDKYHRRQGINEFNERSGIEPETWTNSLGDILGAGKGAQAQPLQRSACPQGKRKKCLSKLLL